MKKSKLPRFGLVILALLLFSYSGMAQRKLSGVVEDAKTNSPLEGATISVKNSKIKAVSKSGGNFEINIPKGKDALEISFVGYDMLTVTLTPGDENITVKLTQSESQLNDVVVVGYGSVKKKDLTGAVSSINSDHLNLGGTTTDLGQAIQG